MVDKEVAGWVKLPHLRAWRAYNLLSQQELADKAGISRGTIVSAEQGARVRVSNVARLAAALGIDRRTLVHQAPPSDPDSDPDPDMPRLSLGVSV